jgi:hypothetical protein
LTFILAAVFHLDVSWCSDARIPVRAGSARFEVHVASLREKRDAGVVKQRFDFSCGTASLATLLTYGLNDSIGEDALLRTLLDPLQPDQIRALQRNGLSLLDLQRLANQRGHNAQGFRIEGTQLAKLPYPVIVFIRPGGYRHFAVLKGIRGGRVYLADPSLGNVRVPMYRFLAMWADKSRSGVIFVVERSDSRWPDHFSLQLSVDGSPPLEALSAARMMEIGSPAPLAPPRR